MNEEITQAFTDIRKTINSYLALAMQRRPKEALISIEEHVKELEDEIRNKPVNETATKENDGEAV